MQPAAPFPLPNEHIMIPPGLFHACAYALLPQGRIAFAPVVPKGPGAYAIHPQDGNIFSVDALTEYRRKRKFAATPEPEGKVTRGRGQRFVVQKHDATRLHYDLRLEIAGVLKSWAVPKGPSLNPADKRLAVQTEDHPMEYASFEGVIPEGQYGAGSVMVWDHGTYKVLEGDDAAKKLAQGELKFLLRGKKLRGSFVLVKIQRSEKGNEWLLIKHRDQDVDTHWDIAQHDGSVLTGRSQEEIADGLPAAHTMMLRQPAHLPGARKAPMPAKVEPMLASLGTKPFSDPQWLFEIKWDGVRTLAWVRRGKVDLKSRARRDVTPQYPELKDLAEHLDAGEALLDGEIVSLDAQGRSSFARIQQRMNVAKPTEKQVQQTPVVYYLFDLLWCDGYDLRDVPLVERKRMLRQLLRPGGPIRFSDHQAEQGRELFELAAKQGLEGILAKHSESRYVSKRSPLWVKLKVTQEIDAVVGGWTAPRGAREFFGALQLGLYEGKALRFVGGVGSGFDEEKQKEIFDRVKRLESKHCPFRQKPDTKEKAWWVEPKLVVRVRYGEWTPEAHLRHPVFLGLRTDVEPEECVIEALTQPAATPAVVAAPAFVGKVISREKDVEAELTSGREENVVLELDGKRLRLSNLNKVYFPESRITKRELLAYYYRIAGHILPYLRECPMVLRRYPNGIAGESFFQKEAGEGLPEWIETAVVSSDNHPPIRYFLANDRAALLYLTNLGCIDHNPWPSRRESLETPDYVFFDLDPTDGTDYNIVVEVARALCDRLDDLGLAVFPKTSGASGLHIYLPLERRYTYEQARTFAEIVARLVGSENQKLVTMERAVSKRPKNKVLIDFVQNAFGRPLAAPWAVRAQPHAPISMPLERAELRRGLAPERLNIRTVAARLKKVGDPWAEFWKKRQRLEKATERLGKLVNPK
jgi:bifunctional non-homologous end joining protein LigD